jgi:hypothetical protein
LNKRNRPVYLAFSNLFCLKYHVKRAHKDDQLIGKGSVINIDIPDTYIVVETKSEMAGLVIMKWSDIGKEGGFNSLTILGWNSRSAVSPENEMAMRKYIAEKVPDIILLNENGPIENKHLRGLSYKCFRNSLKTGVVFNDKFSVHKTLPLWNNELNMIMKMNSEGKSILLYSFYKSHRLEENDQIDQLIYRLGAIKVRYGELSLLLYGDFNLSRDKFKTKVEDRLPGGYRCHYLRGVEESTRSEERQGELVESYLDYMITYGCVTSEVEILDPIGHSDHKTLRLLVDKEKSLLKPYIRRVCTNVMTKIRNDGLKNHEGLVRAILSHDPLSSLLHHISDLRRAYKPRVITPVNIFNVNEKIKSALEEGKVDWKRLNRLIRRIKTEEYSAFLEGIEGLKMNRNNREYFLKIRFYTHINANTDILREIELDSGEIVTERSEIDLLLYNKYVRMFSARERYEYIYDQSNLVKVNAGDVEMGLLKMSTGKAVSGDMLCDVSVKLILDLRRSDIDGYKRILEGLATLVSQILGGPGIPNEIQTARLLFLNKTATETGKIDNVRPISIDGVVIKLVEAIIAKRLEDFIYENGVLHKNQTGFMKMLGTEVNLLKLREKGRQLKSLGGGYVLFTDFKAAYDSVCHEILFDKLRQMRFPEDLINTIIKFYSSAKTKVGERTVDVRRGVLQGNLFSPMLFNIYVDDLIRELSVISFDTSGYADDLVCLCADLVNLKICIGTLDRWAKKNEIDINHKKSGIMILHRDEGDKRKELLRYPLVNEYKYLGVLINDRMNCPKQIHVIGGRIDKYFSRNKWLIHKYFTTGGLIQIWSLFQKSRLVYGMSTFADDKTRMEELSVSLLKHLKGILRLPRTTNTSRIYATLGITKFKYSLQLQLARTLNKYAGWFGELPPRNLELIRRLDSKFDLGLFTSKEFLMRELMRRLNERYTHKKARKLVGHDIPLDYSVRLDGLYKTCDGRDSMIVKYFCNVGFFRHKYRETCQHCGAPNSREHAVDECKHYDGLRIEAKKKLREIFGDEDLSTMLSKIYFGAVETKRREYKRLVLLMKEYIRRLYMTQVVEEKAGSTG